MEALTSINALLAAKSIIVPNYQRAYSWDEEHRCTFLQDLEDYINGNIDKLEDRSPDYTEQDFNYPDSNINIPYYLGHFIFEGRGTSEYAIVDGQQRLTTAVILLSALYKSLIGVSGLSSIKHLPEWLKQLYCDTVKDGHTYRFSTVSYDNQLFRDYVIDQTTTNGGAPDTLSKKRIIDTFEFFLNKLKCKSQEELIALIRAISQATCTTHVVRNELEAVQMFIFLNNRGKKPTNLEIIKAQLMQYIHLHAEIDVREAILSEINERFTRIYQSIAQIGERLDEDTILNYTVKLYRNKLDNTNTLKFVLDSLGGATKPLEFIINFTRILAQCFGYICRFLDEEKSNLTYHILRVTSEHSIMYPFIIKAMHNGMSSSDLNSLAKTLTQIFLRHRITHTKADLRTRLREQYERMETDAKPIIDHIDWMKKPNGWWWSYWTNHEVGRCLATGLSHNTAKLLLWLYENHLRGTGKAGYPLLRYSEISNPHLEHIAPQTKNQEENNGYCKYDEEFYKDYLGCLGNYLLLSGSHNISLSNAAFHIKRESYNHLQQQLEVQAMTAQDLLWDKEKIRARHQKIVKYLTSIL